MVFITVDELYEPQRTIDYLGTDGFRAPNTTSKPALPSPLGIGNA